MHKIKSFSETFVLVPQTRTKCSIQVKQKPEMRKRELT